MNKIAKLLVGINRLPSTSALYGWGKNSTGALAGLSAETSPITSLSTYDPIGIQYESWAQISTGSNFTLAIKSDGSLWSWGTNTYGQLGDGTTANTSTPKRISTFAWNKIAAGPDYAAAIRSDGLLFTWGNNTDGQLGHGGANSRSSPTQVGVSSWSQVSAGYNHTAAIRSDSTLWTWGYGLSGELGDGTGVSRSSPVQVGNNNALPTANIFSLSPGFITEWGTTDLTAMAVGNAVYNSYQLQLPFAFTFAGQQYNSIYIDAQSVIKFDAAGLDSVSLGDSPQTNHSLQRIWYGTTGQVGSRKFRVRFEGTADSMTGTLGSPTLLWELTLDEAVPKQMTVWRATAYNYNIEVRTKSYLPYTSGYQSKGVLIAQSTFGGVDNSAYIITTTGGSDIITTARSWVQVSAGRNFTAGIRSDNNQLYTWGANDFRQTSVYIDLNGNGSSDLYAPLSPVQIGTRVLPTDPNQTQFSNTIYYFHLLFGGSLPSSWSQVSAGQDHVMAIDTDNKLWAWGRNQYGQCGFSNSSTSPVAFQPAQVGNNSWSKVIAGIRSSIAIKSDDDSLWAWGDNTNYQVNYVASNTSWLQISSRGTYDAPNTYGITADGSMYYWGSVPTATQEGSSWTYIATGKNHQAAIKADGTLWTWGNNASGQLGIGSIGGNFTTPLQINGSWTMVATGTSHTAAIKTDGTMWAWGSAPFTQDPTQIAGSWTSVAAGNNTTIALKNDGTIHTVGQNYYGQLGYDSARTSYASWTTMAGSLDGSHGAIHAIKTDGTLWTWGQAVTTTRHANGVTSGIFNNQGIFGTTADYNNYNNSLTYNYANGAYSVNYIREITTPQQISGSWTQVSSGREHVVGIQTNYKLYGWGRNTYNQLGNTSIVSANTPILIDQTYSWTQVTAGVKYNIAMNSLGQVFGWGSPDAGALLSVANLPTSWLKIAQGRNHVLAIANNGYLYSWGDNGQYQRGIGTTNPVTIPVLVSNSSWSSIAAGANTSFAIRSDGTLWMWGKNSYYATSSTYPYFSSPVQVASLPNNFAKIVASGPYVYVLRSGSNGIFRIVGASQTEIATVGNTSNYSWTQIAAAGRWTTTGSDPTPLYGIREDGTMWGEGYVPGYVNNASWKQIDTSSIYRVVGNIFQRTTAAVNAIRKDGTLWWWGYSNTISQNQVGGLYLYRSSPVQIGTANTWSKTSRDEINEIAYAIKTDGTLWDVSTYRNNANQSSPIQIGTDTNWSDVSTNAGTVLLLKTDGSMYGMGSALIGVPGSTTWETTPVKIDNNSWAQVSAGYEYNMAIKSDGTLWTWGFANNLANTSYGHLGVTTARSSLAPVSWTQIAYTDTVALALASDGKLYAWGLNTDGELGSGSRRAHLGYPRLISSDTWTHIATTSRASFGIKSNGTLWSWGINTAGELGLGDRVARSSPVQVGTSTDWTHIVADGYYGTVFGMRGTSLYGWGFGGYGLGDGSTSDRSSPVLIGTGYSTAQVGSFSSNFWVLAIKTDGTLWSWGYNGNGQLGQGHRLNLSVPTQVGAATDWRTIAAGRYHALGVRGDRGLYVWGRNADYSQLGLGPMPQTPQDRSSPVQIGSGSLSSIGNTSLTINNLLASDHKSFITFNNGEMWYAGTANSSSYETIPPGDGTYGLSPGYSVSWLQAVSSGVAKLPKSAKSTHTGFYIKTDGTLMTWSKFAYANVAGYLRSPYTSLFAPGATSISPTQILTTGTQDYLNEPVQVGTATNWTYVTAGLENTAAINSSGKLFMWGRNTDGQLGIGNTMHVSAPTQVGNVNWGVVKTKTGLSSNGGVLSTQVVGITTDNRIFEWGYFDYVGGVKQRRSSPVQLGSNANSNILAVLNYGDIEQYPGSIAVTNSDVSRMIVSRFTHLQPGGSRAIGNNEILSDYVDDPSTPGQTRSIQYRYMNQTHDGSWSQISTSNSHSLAIKADGTLWAWGGNQFGELGVGSVSLTANPLYAPVQIGSANNWTEVSAGAFYSMARKSDGTLWGWGWNRFGQMGISSYQQSYSSPVQIGSNTDWMSVVTHQDANTSADVNFVTYALVSNGSLYAAGSGYFGDNTVNTGFQTSTTFQYVTPVSTSIVEGPQVLLSGSWTQISSGLSHIMAIRTDGTLWAWGSNEYGQIGDNTIVTRSSPVQIGTASWSWVSAGPRHTVAISNNQLYVWGDNAQYQIGDTTSTLRSSPVQVGNAISWYRATAGDGFTIAIENTTNDLYGWGNVPYTGSRSSPVLIDSGNWANIWAASSVVPRNQTEIKYSGFYTLANTNVLYMQGQGPVAHTITSIVSTDGAVGLTVADGNARTSTNAFAQVGSSSWTYVSAGAEQMAAISGNTLFTWGLNNYGQLGDVTIQMRSSPVQISAGWSKVAMGDYSTSAIKTNGTLWTWGRNTNGELGNGDTNKAHTSSPAQIGTANTWTQVTRITKIGGALKANGAIYMWGANGGYLAANNTAGSLSPQLVPTYQVLGTSSPVQIDSGAWDTVDIRWGNTAIGIKQV